jgi:hypothetical protein
MTVPIDRANPSRPDGVRGIAPKVCKVCRVKPVAKMVDQLIADGETDDSVASLIQKMRLTRKDQINPGIVAWHRLGGAWCEAGKKTPNATPGAQPKDLATLVRDKVEKAVASGRLQPTLQHGLIAQSMLDKRAERMADRQLALTVAGLLAGRGAPPQVIIEGLVREVEPLLLEAPDVDDLSLD